MDDLTIRVVQKNDVKDVIVLHQQVFGGSLGVNLGEQYLTAFFDWFLSNPDAIYLVAVKGGQICGYVFGAPHGYGKQLNRRIFLKGIFGVLLHADVIFHPHFKAQFFSRIQSLLSFQREKTELYKNQGEVGGGDFSLVVIGVSLTMQKMGIGSQLFDEFASQVKERTLYNKLRLTVYADNLQALSFYEKNKWYCLDKHQGNTIKYYFDLVTENM